MARQQRLRPVTYVSSVARKCKLVCTEVSLVINRIPSLQAGC